MINRRVLLGLGLTAGALGVGGSAVWANFAATLRFHRARVSHGSQLMASRFGQLEFATVGQGTPVLAVHGAGGGFDQVLSAASRLVAAGYQLIAPSRFGYLRSASPHDPSPARQADAFADLLDRLKIQNVAVVGVSAGALSVLQFAVRHPDRCRSVTAIVPAVYSDASMLPVQSPLTKALIKYTIGSDLLFWLGITLARGQMIRALLATDPALVAAASPSERRRVDEILRNVMPLAERTQGLINDVRYTSAPQSIALEQIKAPTLVVSLEDDFFRTIAPARYLAAHIPGAQLITYAKGGHIWVGHDAELFAAVGAFLKRN